MEMDGKLWKSFNQSWNASASATATAADLSPRQLFTLFSDIFVGRLDTQLKRSEKEAKNKSQRDSSFRNATSSGMGNWGQTRGSQDGNPCVHLTPLNPQIGGVIRQILIWIYWQFN